ncbi:MAG: CopG family antitoxin [Dehalococcoidia bacterium]
MVNLEPEERDVLETFERDEWQSISDLGPEIGRYREAARTTFKKDKRVNIRISHSDLESLQVRALEEGIPYQTLMASILHKYINGRLVEKQSR